MSLQPCHSERPEHVQLQVVVALPLRVVFARSTRRSALGVVATSDLVRLVADMTIVGGSCDE